MGCHADAFKRPIISGAIYCLPFYGQISRKQLEMLISKSQLLCCDCEAVRSAILATAWLLVMFVFLCFMQSFRPCRLCAFVTLTKITLLTQITIDKHKYNGGTHCIKHTAVNFLERFGHRIRSLLFTAKISYNFDNCIEIQIMIMTHHQTGCLFDAMFTAL